MTTLTRIGIIGYGNMGSSIALRIQAHYPVSVFDKDAQKIASLKGVTIVDSAVGLIKSVDAAILAVKPQDFNALLEEIKGSCKNKLIISIAAGRTTASIEKILGQVSVVRLMPNIAARIGESATSLCKGAYATEEELKWTGLLFGYVGNAWIMPEDMIDAATAISGSGPAYIFYDMQINRIDPLHVNDQVKEEYIKRLKFAALDLGFDSKVALELAACTTGASLRLIQATNQPPEVLRKMVTSKGGTTEAAIKVLERKGSWSDAARAALLRAKELSSGG
jgi:pyrroline-5-carboxylate reductase